MRAAALVLAGCAPRTWTAEGGCLPELPAPGEVRVRPVACSEELPAGGEGRVGEWILENAVLRVIVRGSGPALTRLGRGGGTAVDLAPGGGADPVAEVLPLVDGEWFEEVEAIEPVEEDGAAALRVRGRRPGGGEAELAWRLAADEPVLVAEGAEGFEVLPAAGAETVGVTLEAAGAVLGVPGADLEDEGGRVRWVGGDALVAAPRAEAYAALWPDGADVSGEADADWIEARDADGATLARLPVEDGAFAGRVPPDAAALVAVAEGRGEGEAVPPGTGLSLAAGEEGWVRVRVQDDAGVDIPATLWWGGVPWPVAPGGGRVPVGPGRAEAVLSAGPGHELVRLGELDATGGVRVSATLRRAGPPALLAAIGVEAWRDAGRRAEPASLLPALAGRGVRLAVLVADDEVAGEPAVPEALGDWIAVRAGSRADTDAAGRPLAWPWTASSRRAAHGAAPWAELDPADLLAVLDDGGDRIVVVDAGWAAAAGPPWEWDPAPAAFRLDSLDDLAAWAALLDQWAALPPVGPLTWIDGLSPAPAGDEAWSAVDAEALLLEGRTSAGNGPRVAVGALPAGPAGVLVRVEVVAPEWMPLAEARLVGPGLEELARWDLADRAGARWSGGATVPGDVAWVVAVVEGAGAVPPVLEEPAWAVSAPAWIGRP